MSAAIRLSPILCNHAIPAVSAVSGVLKPWARSAALSPARVIDVS
ncbi:hypothetical protein RGAI101_2288 [Roseobacter sp. GAI101]|nr:hypothetical protein RGAI101_2288 [Roseobacter sp. GAI101]